MDVVTEIEEAFVAHWSIFGRWKHGELHDENGVLWFETPIKHLPYNGIIRTRIGGDADAVVAAVIDRFRTRGVQFFWLVHPSARPRDLSDRLAARGLQSVENATGMSLELTDWKGGDLPAGGGGPGGRAAAADGSTWVWDLGDEAGAAPGRRADRVAVLAPTESPVHAVEFEPSDSGEEGQFEEWPDRYLFDCDWMDPLLYDIMINTAVATREHACALIVAAAHAKELLDAHDRSMVILGNHVLVRRVEEALADRDVQVDDSFADPLFVDVLTPCFGPVLGHWSRQAGSMLVAISRIENTSFTVSTWSFPVSRGCTGAGQSQAYAVPGSEVKQGGCRPCGAA
jgi:hypothetical protein